MNKRLPANRPAPGMTADEIPERASLPWRALLALLGRLPQATLSRALGRLADLRIPRGLRRPFLGAFSTIIGIDRSEVELPLADYPSLNAFFVRRLRPGVRSWPEDPGTAGSPVDGFCGQSGRIEAGQILQAKGRWYTAAALLDDEAEATRFDGGAFLTIYLSPRNYHRIHAPVTGMIPRARHIPGALLPVNPPGVLEIPDLFPRSERIVCYMEGSWGRAAVIAVGAFNVGRISTSFDPAWTGSPGQAGDSAPGPTRWVTNRREVAGSTHTYTPPVQVERGEEIMAFHLGSTVVLLFEPGSLTLSPELLPGMAIRLGEPIGIAP